MSIVSDFESEVKTRMEGRRADTIASNDLLLRLILEELRSIKKLLPLSKAEPVQSLALDVMASEEVSESKPKRTRRKSS